MQTRSRNTFTSIHTEGSLLPADLLQRILAGGADCIVSGDADLLALTPFEDIPILRPAEFLARL